jgi:UDP-N-acetyl-D-mannosaminuronic acid dehydrogenase
LLDLLVDKVRNQNAVISVLGLGRVGLPLATVFANSGFKVIGIDNNSDRLESIKKGECPFYDPQLQENLDACSSTGNLSVILNFDKNVQTDIIFITVGTPNTEKNNADYSQLYSALREVCQINLKDKMIIMRSTMPPKTTDDIIIPFIEFNSNLKAGIDFAIAVCPERILEGQAIKEIQELPEIIGGFNEICNNIATELFKKINPNKDLLYLSPSGAELAKLFTNIYRYISFALSNEFAIWAEKYGLDASELIKIANYNYPRSNIPKPGFVGGPCLGKDGSFLDSNTTFSSIVSTAWKLNESIPQHIVNNIKNLLGLIFNKKITVLGLSFKSGSDDLRDSPSVKLVNILESTGAKVTIHDPYVKTTSDLSTALDSPDVIILATNHKEFKNLASAIQQSGCKIIYDVWGMYDKDSFTDISYFQFGTGS